MKYVLALFLLSSFSLGVPGISGILGGGITHAAQVGESPELRVAAAADLQFVMPELEKAFHSAHPELRLKISFGASGNLTSQIEQGAPFDIFLSADSEYPADLVRKGVAAQPFGYVQGQLVFWMPNSSSIDLKKVGLKALLDPSVHKVAIANPEHAPYGRAAIATLKSENLYDAVQKRLVIGENVSQAAQYLETQVADAGFIAGGIAQSKAMSEKGQFIVVPASDYPAIHQSAVILSRSTHHKAAEEFRAFLLSPEARAIFSRFGYLSAK